MRGGEKKERRKSKRGSKKQAISATCFSDLDASRSSDRGQRRRRGVCFVGRRGGELDADIVDCATLSIAHLRVALDIDNVGVQANAKLPKQAILRPPTPKRAEREEVEEGEISAEGASKRVAIGSQGAASSSAVELATAAATGGLGGPPPPPELTDADLLNGVPGVGSAVAPMAVDGMD